MHTLGACLSQTYWMRFSICVRLSSPEADGEMEFWVQDVYLGLTPMKERGRRRSTAAVQLRQTSANTAGSSGVSITFQCPTLSWNGHYTSAFFSHWIQVALGKVWSRVNGLSAAEIDPEGADCWRVSASCTSYSWAASFFLKWNLGSESTTAGMRPRSVGDLIKVTCNCDAYFWFKTIALNDFMSLYSKGH